MVVTLDGDYARRLFCCCCVCRVRRSTACKTVESPCCTCVLHCARMHMASCRPCLCCAHCACVFSTWFMEDRQQGLWCLPLVVVQGSTGWHAEHASSATCPVHQPFFQCHMLALFILIDCAFHLTSGCQRCGMHSCVRDRCTQSILQTFVGASQMACSALALCLCVC